MKYFQGVRVCGGLILDNADVCQTICSVHLSRECRSTAGEHRNLGTCAFHLAGTDDVGRHKIAFWKETLGQAVCSTSNDAEDTSNWLSHLVGPKSRLALGGARSVWTIKTIQANLEQFAKQGAFRGGPYVSLIKDEPIEVVFPAFPSPVDPVAAEPSQGEAELRGFGWETPAFARTPPKLWPLEHQRAISPASRCAGTDLSVFSPWSPRVRVVRRIGPHFVAHQGLVWPVKSRREVRLHFVRSSSRTWFDLVAEASKRSGQGDEQFVHARVRLSRLTTAYMAQLCGEFNVGNPQDINNIRHPDLFTACYSILQNFKFLGLTDKSAHGLEDPRPSSASCAAPEGLTRLVATAGLAVALSSSTGSFFHFTVNALVRLVALSRRSAVWEAAFVLMEAFPYAMEVASLLGIPRSRILPLDGCALYLATNAFYMVEGTQYMHEVVTAGSVGSVRRALLGPVLQGLPVDVPARALLLARSDDVTGASVNVKRERALENHVELLAAIREALAGTNVSAQTYIFDAGSVPLTEQMIIFNHAVLIVGVDGAALANVIWMAGGMERQQHVVDMIPAKDSWGPKALPVKDCGAGYIWQSFEATRAAVGAESSAELFQYWALMMPHISKVDPRIRVPLHEFTSLMQIVARNLAKPVHLAS